MVKKQKEYTVKDVPKFLGIRLKPIHQTLIKEMMITSQINSYSECVKRVILNSGYVARERNKRIKEIQILINNYNVKSHELTFSNN